MKGGVSEIIGQALFGDGARATAYRALRPLFCASCGGVVAAGEMFTRDAQAGQQGLRLWPRCQACVPFAFAPEEQQRRQPRSPLLKSLLTPTEQEETTTAKGGVKEQETTNERDRTADALRQRLGPALAHARRTRLRKR